MRAGASSGLAARIEALHQAIELSQGRSDPEVIAEAGRVVAQAGERMRFSGDHTVVALAGATGSGKSSLFNALTGTSLAQVAARRPTTSRVQAAGWGTDLPHELLDWLGADRRNLIPTGAPELQNLVLLDLPDHDSVVVDHRLRVDELVQRVDALIWVVDPQKYADAVLHEDYLKPLAAYADVMMVALNQADLLDADELQQCLRDLRGLLDAEGLRRVPVVTVSALDGTGIGELRQVLERMVARKQAANRRLLVDLSQCAKQFAADLGPPVKARVDAGVRREVEEALARASGVPVVVAGVQKAWRRRGAAATGWPFVSWLSRLRPDPLRRLRLSTDPDGPALVGVGRTSIPPPSGVQLAQVDQALRELLDAATAQLPEGWAQQLRSSVGADRTWLLGRLDAAISGTDLGTARQPWWWTLFWLLQWTLIVTVLAGVVWLFTNPVLAFLGLPQFSEVVWGRFPAGFWLVGGGLLAGLLLGLLGRGLVALSSNSRAAKARRRLNRAIGRIAQVELHEPIAVEQARHLKAIRAVRTARG